LDHVQPRDLWCDPFRQGPAPAADFEHDVRVDEFRLAHDHVEQVGIGEEVLSEPARRTRRRPESPGHDQPKTLAALASPMRSSSPYGPPRTRASRSAVITTFAGWFGFPRTGCGARKGESVSTRSRSSGTTRAVSRIASAFGYVRLPANEQYQPCSAARSAQR